MKEVVGIVIFSAFVHPLIEAECGSFVFYGDTVCYWTRMWVKFQEMQRGMLCCDYHSFEILLVLL